MFKVQTLELNVFDIFRLEIILDLKRKFKFRKSSDKALKMLNFFICLFKAVLRILQKMLHSKYFSHFLDLFFQLNLWDKEINELGIQKKKKKPLIFPFNVHQKNYSEKFYNDSFINLLNRQILAFVKYLRYYHN